MKKILQNVINLIIVIILSIGYSYADTHKTVWKVRKNLPLNGIAEMTYGHHSYKRMISNYNRLYFKQSVRKGKITIYTPKLSDLFKKIVPQYQQQFQRIFDVIKQYRVILPEYKQLRIKLERTKDKIALPASISERFTLFASMLEETISDFKQMTRKKKTPKKMLAQLKSAAALLSNMAEGKVDGYGYDIDMVEQRIAYALANAVVWVRK
jgi:hypothetical protein